MNRGTLILTQKVIFREVRLNIKITAEGRTELDKLGFDISSSIQGILECVPKFDYKEISYVLVTGSSVKRKGKSIQASYIKKHGTNPAHIELYLKNIFAHIHSFESFKLMIPIQEFGLAQALFHEIGHHERVTKSHGVKNINSEIYADKYTEKRMKIFILKTKKKLKIVLNNLNK